MASVVRGSALLVIAKGVALGAIGCSFRFDAEAITTAGVAVAAPFAPWVSTRSRALAWGGPSLPMRQAEPSSGARCMDGYA